MTVSLTSELEPPELEGDEAIANLDDVHESVESVRGEDEEVTSRDTPPAPQQQVPTEAPLQCPRQVLIEQAVQPIGVWV